MKPSRAPMIVCHCKGLSDRHVRSAVRCGNVTRGSVARSCGAGSDCGGCRRAIDEILAEELSEMVPHSASLAPAQQASSAACARAELTLVEISEPALTAR